MRRRMVRKITRVMKSDVTTAAKTNFIAARRSYFETLFGLAALMGIPEARFDMQMKLFRLVDLAVAQNGALGTSRCTGGESP